MICTGSSSIFLKVKESLCRRILQDTPLSEARHFMEMGLFQETFKEFQTIYLIFFLFNTENGELISQ